MMNGLGKPTRGSIYLNGKDIRRLNEAELRRNVGHVTQQTSLSPNLTIGRNIGQALRSSGSKGQTGERINSRTRELLKMVGMDPLKYMDRFPSELSGGQQQRVGIVRELAREPNILLMDEPFSALDPITRKNLQDDLKKLHGMMRSTIVLVTHDIDEAFKLGDRIVLMRRGRIVQSGSPEDFLKNPANKFVEEFIGQGRPVQGHPVKCAETLTVEKVAVRRTVTASPNLGLARAVRRMRKMRVSTLVVVEDDETLIGIITARDVRKHRNRPGKIADIVQGDIPVVYEGSSAKTAFEALFLGNAGILPVVDDSNRLKGLVTKTSLAQQLYQAVWNCSSCDNAK
jgi:osmoprotectant transport system ATP-binding protein